MDVLSSRAWSTAAALALAAGLLASGCALVVVGVVDGAPDGWREFLISPGFGGAAAVVAASIAYGGVRSTVRSQREATRKQQWWDRARWALDLILREDDPSARAVGYGVLEALADSEYADLHEAEIIDAALQSGPVPPSKIDGRSSQSVAGLTGGHGSEWDEQRTKGVHRDDE